MTLKDIPDDIHRKFKVLCAERGIPMKVAIINFMASEVEHGEETKTRTNKVK